MAVGALDVAGVLFDHRARDDSCPQNAVVFGKQHPGQIIEVGLVEVSDGR